MRKNRVHYANKNISYAELKRTTFKSTSYKYYKTRFKQAEKYNTQRIEKSVKADIAAGKIKAKAYADELADRLNRQLPIMRTEAEFNQEMNSRYSDVSEMIYGQFHQYDKKTVDSIAQAFKNAGIEYDKNKLSHGEYTDDQYKAIKDSYHDFISQGMDSRDASAAIAHMYYGSD